MASDVVAAVALFFGHLDGDERMLETLEFMELRHWLLLDRVLEVRLEENRWSVLSGVCKGFS
jgi:hypothetical protein